MKLFIAIAALTASAANGQATDAATAICIESWRYQDQASWDSTLIPAFEAKHPNIKVTFAPNLDGSAAYYAELPKQLANGTACDLITARPFDTSLELFKKGYLEDVTDMPVLDNFSKTAKTAWQTDDGKITFAVPMASVITGFIYNKDAFDALAIETPETQDDFYAALDKLKEDGTFIPLAMGGAGDFAHAYGSEKGFMSIGPNYWKGEEGRLALLDGSEKLTDEQWVDPWRQLLKWASYTGDNGMSLTQEESMELFMSGAAAVYPVGSWELHDLEEGVNGTFPMGVFKPPVPAEGNQCYIQDHIDMAMAMNAASPHKEAAQTFLDWVGSEEFSTLYANELPGFFPLSTFKVSVDDKLQNDMISWREDCESSIRPFFQFLDRHDPTTTAQSFTACGEVINGVKSPEEAAAEMQAVLETWYEPQMATKPSPSTMPSPSSAFTAVAFKGFGTTFAAAILAALLE
mmetsp:Transcript_5301/g.11216  ORF Transcript_5301/g.11216 Transcript_5301/m.11216 type:complete len:462 (+) Transcript_5301:64-1449(+)